MTESFSKLREVVAELQDRLAKATPGEWGIYGSLVPTQGALEAAPSLSIGSVAHTEPIARFSGYLMDCRANAELCIFLHNNAGLLCEALTIALDTLDRVERKIDLM